tara:strand:+ start:143 stop:382 length:240 start_codon:yes stop_codon:yes gene_type:complete
MFGLGIREIVLTAIVVAAVWYGFKIVNRDKTLKKPVGGENVASGSNPGSVEMRPCRGCGVYVAVGSSDCGTADCPHIER